MTEAGAVAGVALAWLGVAVLTLSEGRRALALGLAVTTAGLALTAASAGEAPSGVAMLVAGGLAAAALRLRSGPPGWIVLPPGSTPRVVIALVVLIAAAIVAGSGLGSPAGAARLASLVVIGLAGARILTVGQRWAALAAGSALALGLAAAGGPVALVAGCVTAAALGAVDPADTAEPAR